MRPFEHLQPHLHTRATSLHTSRGCRSHRAQSKYEHSLLEGNADEKAGSRVPGSPTTSRTETLRSHGDCTGGRHQGRASWPGMNVLPVASASGGGTRRYPVFPGIGAPRPFQPAFSHLSSQQTQGPVSSAVGVAAKARWKDTALKSHFMRHPCSQRPSHAARAAEFPFSARPTQRRGARAQQAQHSRPLSHPLGAPGSRDSQGWHRRALWQ